MLGLGCARTTPHPTPRNESHESSGLNSYDSLKTVREPCEPSFLSARELSVRGVLGEVRGFLGEVRGVLGEMRGFLGEVRGLSR